MSKEMNIEKEVKILNDFKNTKIEKDKIELGVGCFKLGAMYKRDLDVAIEIVLADRERLEDKYIHEKVAKEEVEELLENSISKDKIKEKIQELAEGIKRDMINHDKVKDESWKIAIYRSMAQKIETKKVLEELLKGSE